MNLRDLLESPIIITWLENGSYQEMPKFGDQKMAATKTPVVNYSPELTAKVIADYQAGIAVEKIAEEIGKTVRSVVAKLAREKLYVKKVYTTKTGEKVVKKDTTADAIGAILRLSENDTESLTKANKAALKAIFEALANSKPV